MISGADQIAGGRSSKKTQKTLAVLKSVTLSIATILLLYGSHDARAENWTIRVEVDGRQLEGTPLDWSSRQVLFLERSGQLSEFAPGDAKNFSKTAPGFRGLSSSEMRAALLREFGGRFEVSGAGPYLVVHPKGQHDLWATRFDQLYRSFQPYFSARGLRPNAPQFPLVAIVFRSQDEFQRYAADSGVRISPEVLGFYSIATNRILMYDQTAASSNDGDWQANAETIVHEALHQVAFNTGLHSRYAPQPHWLVEGLAVMFEAPGVWNSGRYRLSTDRINQGRLRDFQFFAERGRPPDTLPQLISSDSPFQSDPGRAYADAWALTFYLVESQPAKYFQYLATIAGRPAHTDYRSPERLRDFTAAFGSDFTMLDAQLIRFIDKLD